MSSRSTTFRIGLGPLLLLTVVFVVLKATSTVDWSWWVVLLPIYIGPAAVFGAMLAVLFAAIGSLIILMPLIVLFGGMAWLLEKFD